MKGIELPTGFLICKSKIDGKPERKDDMSCVSLEKLAKFLDSQN